MASGLLNAMKELSRLTEKYSLEHQLYHTRSGLRIVRELMGTTRYEKFIKKAWDLGGPAKMGQMSEFLQRELKVNQALLIDEKASL